MDPLRGLRAIGIFLEDSSQSVACGRPVSIALPTKEVLGQEGIVRPCVQASVQFALHACMLQAAVVWLPFSKEMHACHLANNWYQWLCYS
mmetsp:Transcript_146891/g.381734  ORF Transcript_146891/g.381734 Transcript_146891/m.381734 type:complete len:90 (+) Transcript_146891:106-375(+)